MESTTKWQKHTIKEGSVSLSVFWNFPLYIFIQVEKSSAPEEFKSFFFPNRSLKHTNTLVINLYLESAQQVPFHKKKNLNTHTNAKKKKCHTFRLTNPLKRPINQLSSSVTWTHACTVHTHVGRNFNCNARQNRTAYNNIHITRIMAMSL